MAIPLKRLAFTDAWLKAVQLSEDRPEYADTKTQGLYLRVGTRSKVFIATYRIKGGPLLRKKLGDYPKLLSLKKARERADEVRRQAKSGIDVRVVEREEREAKERAKELRLSTSVFDLSAMILWYIEQRSGATAKQLAKKTIANYRALHRFYINGLAGKPFRGQPVGEVAPSEIRKMLAEIAKKSATQANRLFELIRASYRLASYEGVVQAIPAIKRPADNVERERVLTQAEIREFWQATATASLRSRKTKATRKRASADTDEKEKVPISPSSRGVLRMLLLLGQRKTETVLMRWKDIDETVWRIPGRFRKGNRAHSVPLSKGALKILDELRPVNGAKERVFHGVSAANLNGRAFGAVREAVMKAAKTDSFTVHDLRRTLATQIRELCHVQPHVVSGILGHSTGKFAAAATSFYDKSTGQDERTAALEAWSKKVSEIAAEGKGASKAGENPPLF